MRILSPYPILMSVLLMVGTSSSLPAAIVGWNNDGSANFPDANPPTEFDGATGKNVKWKTKMPNWSNSSPIVVDPSFVPPGGTTEGKHAKGPRAFCMAEPLGYAPILVCLDADTGQELWRKELDPVPLLPEAEQAPARELARKSWAMLRERKRVTVEIGLLMEKHPDALPKKGPIPESLQAEFAPLFKRAEAVGLSYKGIGRGFNSEVQPDWGQKVTEIDRVTQQKLDDWQLMWSTWENTAGEWEGVAYPTPVTDGRFVYTVTAHNLYSCHDLDGKLIWQRRFPRPRLTDLSEAQKARLSKQWAIHWGGGYFGTSPLLWQGKGAPKEGLLLSNAGAYARALDAGNGAVVWEQPLNGSIGQCMGVPNIVTIDGTPCLITIGNEYKDSVSNDILRLSDGALVGELPGMTTQKGGAMGSVIVLQDGTVVNIPPVGSGWMGWTMSIGVDGKVKTTERWEIKKNGVRFFNLERPAWRGNELFNGWTRLDATTGKTVGEAMRSPIKFSSYDGAYILAGRYFVQCGFSEGKFAFWDLETHKLKGVGIVPLQPADGIPSEVRYANAMRSTWRWLGAATPFAYKNRFYVRSYDFLWCFEGRNQ